jgi:dihydroceramidase
MFHMTLRYSMQLLDEIPMVWSSLAFVYCQHMVSSPPGETDLVVLALLVSYGTTFTAVYLAYPVPIIHQVMQVPLLHHNPRCCTVRW